MKLPIFAMRAQFRHFAVPRRPYPEALLALYQVGTAVQYVRAVYVFDVFTHLVFYLRTYRNAAPLRSGHIYKCLRDLDRYKWLLLYPFTAWTFEFAKSV